MWSLEEGIEGSWEVPISLQMGSLTHRHLLGDRDPGQVALPTGTCRETGTQALEGLRPGQEQRK